MYYNICRWRTPPFLYASSFFSLSPFLFLFVPMLIAWGSTRLSSADMSCYPYVTLSFSPYIYDTLIYHTMLSTWTRSIYRNSSYALAYPIPSPSEKFLIIAIIIGFLCNKIKIIIDWNLPKTMIIWFLIKNNLIKSVYFWLKSYILD